MKVFQDNLLTGKVAVVTGGTSGICLTVAERLAEQGAQLVLVGRKQEKLDAAVSGITAKDGNAIGFSADVRDYSAIESVMKQTAEKFKAIDILVCGAAGNFPSPAIGMSANAFKAVIDIDILGTFNASRAAYEFLRKPGASVINIGAPQALNPMAFQSHVCAAKAGVDMITKTLAVEWGPVGVRVNTVTPGPTEDTEGMRRLSPSAEAGERLKQTIPLRRFGKKDEIADLVLFLCSDAAQYITGGIYLCDGGQSLMGSRPFMDAILGS
jgi:NAD(P)-dependent dehydrogenase (short-subunit alcohol dehydrogenase family)